MKSGVTFYLRAKDEVSGKLSKIRDDFDRLGKSKGFMSVAQGVGMGVGISAWNALGDAARAAGDWLGDSIGVASQLNEAMNKSAVVFGGAAGQIEQFGRTSAEAFGVSKLAAYEAAGTFGNLFTTMGLGKGAAADMSVSLIELAADLASFHDIAIDDALQKLQSGLVGEAEPMRQLGVLLDEASVKAKAMKMGLGAANRELTQAEKVQARYALILEQSSAAQGDFGRTSESLANTTRRLTSEMEDLQAEIGEELEPIVVAAMQAMEGAVSDLSRELQYQQWYFAEIARLEKQGIELKRNFIGSVDDERVSVEAFNAAMAEQERQFKANTAWSARLQGQADALAGALDDTGQAAEDSAKEFADLERRTESLWDEFIEGTRAATRDEQLELEKLPAQIREAQRDVRAAQKELEGARTQAQKDEAQIRLVEAKQEVNRLQENLSALKGKFAATGKELGYSLGTNLRAEVRRWVNLTISQVRRLDGISYIGPGTNSAGPQYRAGGGPVTRGEAYVVGEDGPELFIPRASGQILSNDEVMAVPTPAAVNVAATATPNVAVAVYLDSDQIAARVERRQYFAASVAPASAR